jgi:hypothetical protein
MAHRKRLTLSLVPKLPEKGEFINYHIYLLDEKHHLILYYMYKYRPWHNTNKN